MNIYIILLRGINVGGKNILPMKTLRTLLEDRGFKNVRTYIQSGNIALLGTRNPKNELGELIQTNFGFTPEVLVLSDDEFNSAASNNPYQASEGKFIHCYFCKETPKVDAGKLKKLAAETECYELIGKVFYLFAPNGIGRSKLVKNIETCLGTTATGRNLNTINKLKEIIKNA